MNLDIIIIIMLIAIFLALVFLVNAIKDLISIMSDIKDYTFKSYMANRIFLIKNYGLDLEKFCRKYNEVMESKVLEFINDEN